MLYNEFLDASDKRVGGNFHPPLIFGSGAGACYGYTRGSCKRRRYRIRRDKWRTLSGSHNPEIVSKKARTIMPNNCQLIAGKINTERIAARAIEKLSRLYSNKTHFIYELIQNSDDARSDELYVSMEEDELWLWHHGRPFTEENVIAICSVGESSKDLTQIGTHGVRSRQSTFGLMRPKSTQGIGGFASKTTSVLRRWRTLRPAWQSCWGAGIRSSVFHLSHASLPKIGTSSEINLPLLIDGHCCSYTTLRQSNGETVELPHRD